MAKEVKNRITLDASRFERGATAVTRASGRMQKSLGEGMRRAARAGAAGLAAAGAAGIGMGVGIAAGVKKVIGVAGELDDLSKQTDSSVAKLMQLKQTFLDGGGNASRLEARITKTTKAVAQLEAGGGRGADTLTDLGFTLEKLQKMDPATRFEAVATAISAIEDPVKKVNASLAIWGERGIDQLGVFEAGNLEDSAQAIGKQAELLEKNAAVLSRAGTLLDRSGLKLQGFFVGVADKVVPVILPLLERLDKLDLAEQGQQFGQGIANGLKAVIGLFETNTIGDLTRESLLLAGTQFLNSFARGWAMIFSGTADTLWAFGKQLVGFWKTSLTQLATGFIGTLRGGFATLVDFTRASFTGIAASFLATIMNGLGKTVAKIPGLSERGEQMQENAARIGALAGNRREEAAAALANFNGVAKEAFAPLVETLKQAPFEFQSKLGNAFLDGALKLEDWDLISTDGMKGRMAELIKNAMDATDVAPVESSGGNNKGGGDNDPEENPLGSLFGNSRTAQALTGGVSSLAAIGGGGGVGAASGIETAVQAGNEILRGISNEIRGMRNDQRGMRNQQFGLGAPVLT